MHILNIKNTRKPYFLTSKAIKTFNHLQLAFIKAPILQYFDLESYIWIKTGVSGYGIDRVLNELKLDFNTLSNNSNLNKFDFR